ncbi:MAG: T9SS type A sorting domain-containing protein [Bacteroidota bacterium]
MKKISTILCCLFVALLAFNLQAQENRFLTEVFDEVTVTNDVTYGVNATIIAFTQLGEAIPEELKMDVYQPAGDNLGERPVVMVYHTGNFLPNVTNGGITGTRQDSSTVEFCTRLAKAGYVAAAVDYRLGWNPLAATQPERALGLIQAAYRGVQDGRTCIRYFKKTVAEDGNPFGVDTTRMTAFGTGTGGYLVLGLATLSDYNEILLTTNGPGKFLFDPGTGVPIPMVIEAYHGDIEGKVLTIAPDGAFGFPAGDTTNYVNWPEYGSDFQLCANVGGALGDISWINAGEPPIISVQSAFDQFAPYDDATLIVPTTGDPIVQVQGGKAIAIRQDELGNNQVFIDAGIDDVWTDAAIANSATAGDPYLEALYPVTNPANSSGFDEGVVIDWWNENDPSPADGAGMGIPWNMLPHPSGGTFHTQGLILNEGMSAEKARTNIDTIMGYFYPRAFAALNLIDVVRVDNINPSEVQLTIAPNPVSHQLMLTSAVETPMRNIRIFDMNGRLVRSYEGIDADNYFINRGDLTSGTYIITTEFDEGLATHKVIFK